MCSETFTLNFKTENHEYYYSTTTYILDFAKLNQLHFISLYCNNIMKLHCGVQFCISTQLNQNLVCILRPEPT